MLSLQTLQLGLCALHLLADVSAFAVNDRALVKQALKPLGKQGYLAACLDPLGFQLLWGQLSFFACLKA